ncbi:MAG: DUF4157 domain-containing protein, partial [Deltaproteobacteria bacterium]|nr:DUF4157 domain-containing protein [Deltaproteobacteria bacterium]
MKELFLPEAFKRRLTALAQDRGADGSGPMEQAFGVDLGGVRVHADHQADQLNRSLRASAFATGQDIFLRQGEYNPQSHSGQELLAHELTHVMQQNKSRKASYQPIEENVIQRAWAHYTFPNEITVYKQREKTRLMKKVTLESGQQVAVDKEIMALKHLSIVGRGVQCYKVKFTKP